MARATLTAPIDGVVISGDLSQSIGSPVERGQLLFEVASPEDYRLVVMVDEADIGWVEIGQPGHLRLRRQGANRFRVEAALNELPATLRPGMNGVAKIEIDERPVGWIWTRTFVDWVRYQLWKYGV